MRRLHAVERTTGRLAFGALGRQLDHLLPLGGRRLQVLFTEGEHDAFVEQRLGMPGVQLQAPLEHA